MNEKPMVIEQMPQSMVDVQQMQQLEGYTQYKHNHQPNEQSNPGENEDY